MTAPSEQAPLSFDALYREASADLFAYVMTIVRDRQAAEDLTHAAFERAYRLRDRYRPGRGTQRAWLFGSARNAALDELRRRRRSARLSGEVADTAAADGPDPIERSAVRAALATLDARDRELIALKFYAGLTNEEIARVLGLSTSNAGTRLHRAVQRLREACHA